MVFTGILTAITIVGIIIAWLPIWLGVLLFQAAGRIDTAFATEDEMSLRESLAKLKTFFVIQGVLLLIYIAIAVGAILLGGLRRSRLSVSNRHPVWRSSPWRSDRVATPFRDAGSERTAGCRRT